MKDDSDISHEETAGAALEARIVAWVLGEASAFEAAELERRCAEEPALREFERRMRELHGLIGGDFAVKPEADWRLPEGKRSRITDLLGVEEAEGVGREKTARYFGRRMLLAAAACVALTVVAWPVFMTQEGAGKAPAKFAAGEPMAREWLVERDIPEEVRQKEMVRELRNAVGMQEAEVRVRQEALSGEVRKAGDGGAKSPATEALAGSQDLLAQLKDRLTAAEMAAQGGVSAASGYNSESHLVDLTKEAQTKLAEVGEFEGFVGVGEPLLKAPVDLPVMGALSREGVSAAGSPPNAPAPARELAREFASRGKEDFDAVGLQSGNRDGRRSEIEAVSGKLDDAKRSDNEVLSVNPYIRDWSKDLAIAESLLTDAATGGLSTDFTTRVPGQARSQEGHSAWSGLSAAPADPSVGEDLAGNDFDLSRMSELTKQADSNGRLATYIGFTIRVDGYNESTAWREFSDLSQMGELIQERGETGDSGGALRLGGMLYREHAGNVEDVRRSLYLAEGSYNLGRFDDAKEVYADVLRIDPYNKAARRGLERVEMAKSDYYRAAYDHTRAELLAQVDAAWELSVPHLLEEEAVSPSSLMDGRVKGIILPRVDFEDVSVGEALDFLRMRTVELDAGEADPSKRGMNFVIRKMTRETNGVDPETIRIRDLHLENASLEDVIGEIAKAAGLEVEVGDHAVIFKVDPNAPVKTEAPRDAANEIETAAEPFSTFSLHVSDASFRLAGAAMERGERPAAESVRVEEFYNAFDYGDPAPAGGEPVACAIEQAAHPALPQRNLVRIGVRTGAQGRGGSTPLNLTLLLDSSGSMEREDRREGLARAVESLAGLLKEGDTVTVASFARQPRLLADRLPGAEAAKLGGMVAGTPSEGGTNLEEGLKLAGELAQRQFREGAQNRIVLFTDGAANLGDAEPESLQAMVEGFRQRGIAFDAAGFGAEGLNDRLLERLTRNGNGRYYVVDRPEDAEGGFAAKLAGAFRPAAEDVKVQVRFNAGRVARYRLIGFEEHRLAKEDFRDDSVDAAEMAAEEAGNALYQIEVLPQGEGDVGEVSVRFRDAGSGEMVERSWTIPYEARVAGFDEARPSLQLAGLAALVAGNLRGEVEMVDLGEFAPVMARVRGHYAGSEAVEVLGRMFEEVR